MANSSKYLKIDQNILLEWIYDSENFKQESYYILNNLSLDKNSYISQTAGNLNLLSNTIFPIDNVLKKYSKVDSAKYNFLKLATYSSSYIQFDKIRLHLPTTYSFFDNDYKGLFFRVFTYGYSNKKIYDFCSYLYDDAEINSYKQITLNEEFYFDEQSWGKYIELTIPSLDAISKQRTSTVSTDLALNNSVNSNLTNGNGISLTSPIFLEFGFVTSKQEILGNTYYFLGDMKSTSISKVPEYQDLAANIIESTNGDYFEIYGSYGGNNESLDEFIDELTAKGRRIKIEYHVSLFEENILSTTQIFSVSENFTKKIGYRPILNFTNTTAAIDVEMKVIDLVDNSQFSRFASIGLRNNIFKYGKKLTPINVTNIFKPKIYNLKNSQSASNMSISNQIPDINLTKVNYPVIVDRIKILASSAPSVNSDYKPIGLSEIVLNPFGNYLKFMIASDITNKGDATPYDLTKVTENSTLTLMFKSDDDFFEKDMWKETDENNFELGIVLFKIEEQDVPIIKRIGKSNKNFYIIIKSEKTGSRSLLYSGTWVHYDDIKFLETSKATVTSVDINNFTDSILSDNQLNSLVSNGAIAGTSGSKLTVSSNFNLLIFLDANANVKTFEDYLKKIKANIFIKKPGSNSSSLTYLYLILNININIKSDIDRQNGVRETVRLDFNLGQDITGDKNATISLDAIKNRIVNFNCSNADRISKQNNSAIR